MKTPEEILIDIELKEFASFTSNERYVIYSAMEEYGKQQYNQAIKDAAENCTTELTSTCIRVYKDSILKLLKP